MEITRELQESYVKSIDHLFGGAIRAYPDEVNIEVIEYVDKMFAELSDCHMTMAIFAIPFQLIGEIMDGLIPNELKVIFGTMTFAEYVDAYGIDKLKDKVGDIFNVTKAIAVLDFLNDMHKVWIDYTVNDKRLVMCINVARVNWRSRVQMALWDL